jgi:branched-chain amino acid transport system permease protein
MKGIVPGLLFIAAITFPLFFREYWLYVATIGLYYAILASSWSMLAGQVGLISFAHAAFAGIGAYTSALLFIHLGLPIPFTMLAGALTAALFGLGIGALTLRMRGPYLALTTLAFSEIFRILITAEYQLTQGSIGLKVPLMLGGSKLLSYYIGLGLFLLTVLILSGVLRSRVGLFLVAMREDEDGAETRGINTGSYRLIAFVLTSAFAGLAGGYYAHVVGLVSPQMTRIGEMGLILAMSVFGGLESLLGAALGAVILQGLTEYLRIFTEWRLAIFGGLVLFTLKFTPEGILPSVYLYADRLLHRKLGTPPR